MPVSLNRERLDAACRRIVKNAEDRAACGEFVTCFEPVVGATIYRFGKHFPEDLAQEIRMRLSLQAASMAPKILSGEIDQPKHYAMTIARNVACNFWKRQDKIGKREVSMTIGSTSMEFEQVDALDKIDPAPAAKEFRERVTELKARLFEWIGERWEDGSIEQRYALKVLDTLQLGYRPTLRGPLNQKCEGIRNSQRRMRGVAHEVLAAARAFAEAA